jgi:DNA-binding XRE family transcriptional regulator
VPLGLMRANSTGMSARACAERRIMLGLSQQQLAELIWVAYQQAHKYERGTNRRAAGRLYKTAQVLGVDVGYFFGGIAGTTRSGRRSSSGCCWNSCATFMALPHRRHQQEIVSLVRALAEPAQP